MLLKLLKRIIYRRQEAFSGQEFLSDRKVRSTLYAIEMVMTITKDAISGERWLEGDKEYCAIIIVDVKIAFNSVDWDATLAASKDILNYLLLYFKDRVLLYDTYDGRKSYAESAGVPQVSVMCPIL